MERLKKDFNVLDLNRDQVLLMSVRKIHNLDPRAGKDAWKAQIMCAEHIDNPYRPINPTSLLNEGDPRFTGNRPRRGWTTVEPSQWDKHFGNLCKASDIEKLKFSSVTQDDVDSIQDLQEGVHFITLNVLNPTLKVGKDDLELHVRIIESTVQRNENQPQKINPAVNPEGGKREEGQEGQPQTQFGNPIYVQSTIEFNNPDGSTKPSVFLVSDQMIRSHKEGRLILPDSAIEAYRAAKSEQETVKSGSLADTTAAI